MASETPKLAKATHKNQVATWIAETIQGKVAKENAGLVELSLTKSLNAAYTRQPYIEISTARGERKFKITVEQVRAGREEDSA